MAFNLRTALASIAPTLATMLGGPFAGAAITALEGALGLAPGAGADEITKIVQTGAMTPETLAAVRAADQKHEETLKQQGVDLVKINADHEAAMAVTDASDRDSARKREIAVRGWTTPVMAWTIVCASLALVAATVSGNITKDPSLAGQVGIVTGYLLNEAKSVVAYYFGSSFGSDRKTELIAQGSPGQAGS
jgi:hypothetical protein